MRQYPSSGSGYAASELLVLRRRGRSRHHDARPKAIARPLGAVREMVWSSSYCRALISTCTTEAFLKPRLESARKDGAVSEGDQDANVGLRRKTLRGNTVRMERSGNLASRRGTRLFMTSCVRHRSA